MQAFTKAGANNGQTLGYIDPGDWAAYNGVNVGGATSLRARVVSGGPGGTIQVRTGSHDRPGPGLGGGAQHRQLDDVRERHDRPDRRAVRHGQRLPDLHRDPAPDCSMWTTSRSSSRAAAAAAAPGRWSGSRASAWTCAAARPPTAPRSSSTPATARPRRPGPATGQTLRALGKCLDVSGSGTADGTKIQLWTCNGTGAQNWNPGANGSLVNANSNKCLDVSGNNSADGQVVHLWACHGGANQRWTLP